MTNKVAFDGHLPSKSLSLGLLLDVHKLLKAANNNFIQNIHMNTAMIDSFKEKIKPVEADKNTLNFCGIVVKLDNCVGDGFIGCEYDDRIEYIHLTSGRKYEVIKSLSEFIIPKQARLVE